MTIPIVREVRRRLFRAADDPEFRYPKPRDAARRRLLRDLPADCREYEKVNHAPAEAGGLARVGSKPTGADITIQP